MTKRSLFTLAVFIFLITAGIYYVRLGGLSEMKTQVVQRPAVYLTGKSYYGLSTDDALHAMIKEVHLSLRDSLLKGELMVCYFGNPDQSEDSIKVFVGAGTLAPQNTDIAGMEQLSFPAKRAVQAEINAYSFVAPNPDKVNMQLHELAASNGIALDTVYVERYTSPQQIFNEIYEQ